MNSINTIKFKTLIAILFLAGFGFFAGNVPAAQAGDMHNSAMKMDNHKSMNESENMDRQFIEMMISHHKMAVEKANIELERGNNSELKAIAAKIKTNQMAEIEKMRMWHMEWYGEEPKEHMMDMSMVEQLKNSSNVDKTFVEMMIPHHLQAATMAREEAMKTSNDELRDFSFKIIEDQTMEVNEMFTIYQSL